MRIRITIHPARLRTTCGIFFFRVLNSLSLYYFYLFKLTPSNQTAPLVFLNVNMITTFE